MTKHGDLNGFNISDFKIAYANFTGGPSYLLAGMTAVGAATAPNNDLIVNDEGGVVRLDARTHIPYRPANEAITVAPSSDLEAPAFVLVSHGANGFGAYRVDGTDCRLGDTNCDGTLDMGGDQEIENGDGDGTIQDVRRILSYDSDHFDDIVLWNSQVTLYNALPNGSCETAQVVSN